jgi:glycerol-3-phosphate acyltransferase PlsX
MRIAVDAMGGDHGCGVVVDGVGAALNSNAKITELFLVGHQDEIQRALEDKGVRDSRLKVVHATEVLSMTDKPVEGLRRKKDCSILRAVEILKEGRADALVSTGNTGGIVAASSIRLRQLPGVERPGILTVIPTPKSEFVLLDSGANVECRPIYLAQFAVMGSIYSREILGHQKPRVGILSNGTEDNKGNELTQAAFKLCKAVDLEFVGNVEGHDLFNDRVEVVICDGFVGNIVLKTIESFAKGLMSWVKTELSSNTQGRLAGLLARRAFQKIKRRMDADAYGGAVLLGLNGTIVKAHASARERAIMNAIRVACENAESKVNNLIIEAIAAANPRFAPVLEAILAASQRPAASPPVPTPVA